MVSHVDLKKLAMRISNLCSNGNSPLLISRGSDADVPEGFWVGLSAPMRSLTMSSAACVLRNTTNKT